MAKAAKPYTLRISRKTVDKLGVKLYDRVALVIAELVSNSYDADASTVMVTVPAGEYLATKKAGLDADRGFTIEVEDNGFGMDPDELARFYLVVGSDRRMDERGATTPGGRPVMGRKGVGKLAPFGICRTIEVISAGGAGRGKGAGKEYQIGHVILNYDDIRSEDEFDYHPEVGPLDRTWRKEQGTKVILRGFLTRRVPELPKLAEEIAQRFGMTLDPNDWSVMLFDSQKKEEIEVSTLNIPVMPGTKITFGGPRPTLGVESLKGMGYRVMRQSAAAAADGETKASFEVNGKHYPVVGWVAYGAESAKGVGAGVRVYCRGKLATQTMNFDIGSGFHGEFQVKSYLIGELHCDWLDEDEDLIHTDRQNIQWSSDIGAAFQTWGQGLVREIGYIALKPAQEKTLEIFRESVDLDAALTRAFPNEEQQAVRLRAKDLAESLARKLSPDQARDGTSAVEIFNVATAFAPHFALTQELSAAADKSQALSVVDVAAILARAKLAEAMTLGEVASRRLRLIERFQTLIADKKTPEEGLQSLVEEAPWLVRPEWTPISNNKSLETIRGALERYVSNKLGEKVVLSKIKHPTKRPDFVMIGAVGPLQIVEIKKPFHEFEKKDFDRLFRYVEAFDEFFDDDLHQKTLKGIPGYVITLVADGVKLSKPNEAALRGLVADKKFEQIPWDVLTDRARNVHDDFIQGLEKAGLRIAE
jgi:hypothetical protein